LKEKSRTNRKEEALVKKKYEKLSLTERNAFDEIMERNAPSLRFWLKIALIPFYFLLYGGIFSLVMLFAWGIDLREQLRLIVEVLFDNIEIFCIIGGVAIFLGRLRLNKLSKKLLK
jgi:hypothetical protein